MSNKTKLKLSTDLGFGNTNQKGVTVSDFDFEAFDVILPPVSYAIISERAPDLLDGKSEAEWNRLNEDEQEGLIEQFNESDAYYDWKTSYNPMMLYYWPLFIGDRDPQTVAELMDEFAPCCSLLEIHGEDLSELVGEDYAIVLSGGGMDLSDHLAAAYLCAGSVPPIELLDRLDNTVSKRRLKQLGPALRVAYKQAKAALMMDVERLERARKRIFSPKNSTL